MEVLKLKVDYEGYYGGSVHDYIILPKEWNGLFVEEITKDSNKEVYLGEIEGKHSEVYGDITIELIDLEKLSFMEKSNLINGSDFSNFESFIENEEGNFEETISQNILKKRKEIYSLLSKYDYDKYDWSDTGKINTQFKKYLINIFDLNNEKEIKNINVAAEDLQKAIEVLKNNNIEMY